jgi:DNA-binding response OmpR family regulator
MAGDSKRVILLVEDNEQLRLLVQAYLEDEGFAVIPAGTGFEAVQLYKQHSKSISIVISDFELPQLNGFDAFLMMKRVNPGVKCIIASAFVDPAVRYRFQEEGVIEFLHKPYSMTEVLNVVREIL